MDSLTLKPNKLLGNILVHTLAFAILMYAVRFAYFVTINGGYPQNLQQLSSFSPTTDSSSPHDAVSSGKIRRKLVDYYASVFQDLIAEGFLSPSSKSLCVETTLTGEDVTALKELGVSDSIGISNSPSASRPLILYAHVHNQPFDDNTFDFEFSGDGGLDRSVKPAEFGSEIGRTLKPGGFLVAHTRSKDEYSLHSFLELFNCCTLIRSREIDGPDSSTTIREIVIKKQTEIFHIDGKNPVDKCSVSGYKRKIIENAEPLIEKEPLKPWITLKRNTKNIKYLTSVVDISFKDNYVYIDVGARSYGSSIGSWFNKQYPKQNRTFQIYAIEAEKAYFVEYRSKKGVTFLPYAAWIRNESLFFEITRGPGKKLMEKGRGRMGSIHRHPVQSSTSFMSGDSDMIYGFDFVMWLKNVVRQRDFVVVKMDVEGTEFHLITRLIETGAICLIDEIFLECHYNRWQRCCPGQRSIKYQKTYQQCSELFTSLRDRGILVHQWW